MVFSYYSRLSRADQRIYRASDRVGQLRLPSPTGFRPLVGKLAGALEREDRLATEAASRTLLRAMTDAFGVAPVKVRVLAARPHTDLAELHGLYEPPHGRRLATISVWMRTARRRQVVAFRTFLRTLLHELCHHLDYELLKLKDSFHTAGFYKRESSLFYQLVPGRRKAKPRRG